MPALWLDRLPLPNLPAYTSISVGLLLCSVYFAITTQQRFETDAVSRLTYAEALQRRCLLPPPLNESSWDERTHARDYFLFLIAYPTQRALLQEFLRHKLKSDFLYWPTEATDWGEYGERGSESPASSSVFYAPTIYYSDAETWTRELPEPGIQANLVKTLAFMIHEPLCVWTLINMAYCLLVLLGKSIQQSMFGELRVSEQTQLKDKFWNFVFYKFIFVFGVINVQHMDEVVLWCSWFSALGFLHLLTQLCRDRFEYLSLSANTPGRTHGRLLCLLTAILALSLTLLAICVYVGLVAASLNTFTFMAAECVLLLIRAFHTMIRYAIHLYDVAQTVQWERKGSLVYLAELMFEVTELVIDLLHHVHMLLWGNIILSMASLIICMELRHIFYQLRHRLGRHSHYRRVVRYIELECVPATPADVDGDQCAICWDAMETARRLDCKHCFHATCLRRWLEQDPSCPTCRKVLDLSGQTASGQPRSQQHHRPHWQQHRGRFVSFLPSFSVEVNHTQLVRNNQQEVPASQLDSMARQVQQMFPHVSLSAITEDLQHSGSIEDTVENILEGSVHDLPAPPMFTSDELAGDGRRWSQQAPDGDDDRGHGQKAYQHRTEEAAAPESEPEWAAPAGAGSRFSKSASERHSLLQQRKATMLERARRRYLVGPQDSASGSAGGVTDTNDCGAAAAGDAPRPAPVTLGDEVTASTPATGVDAVLPGDVAVELT